ncbi:MFS transporter [Streptomyces sp. NPDC017940]|uniref:MFS transporter n=1 Tax=Streptomyces sp. NPDC017940 TaxID=3365017 RepID=UPI0037AE2775
MRRSIHRRSARRRYSPRRRHSPRPEAAHGHRRGRVTRMATEKGLGRPFYALLTAAAISTLGDGVRATAVPLLATEFTHNAFLVSIVNFAGWLPWLTVALFSGVLVDRWDRRRTMVYVDGARAVLVLVLALLAIASPESWKWLLLVAVIAFLLGVGETLFDPASQALLPAVVPQHKLTVANSRFQSLQLTGSEFVGPPLGSLLFAAAATLPFLLDSASFLLAAVLVAAIRLPPGLVEHHAAQEREEERMMEAVKTGLRWLWNERPIRTMALILGAWMVVDGGVYAVLVLFSLEELGLGTAGFGLLMTASAVGSIFGSLVAPRVTRLIPGGYALVVSLATFGLGYLAIGSVHHLAVALAGFTLAGLASGVWNVVTVTFRQAYIPQHLFGRVISSYRVIAWGGTALGSLVGGALAHVFGLRVPLLIAGTAVIGLAFVAFVELRHIVMPSEADPDDAPVAAPAETDPDSHRAAD